MSLPSKRDFIFNSWIFDGVMGDSLAHENKGNFEKNLPVQYFLVKCA